MPILQVGHAPSKLIISDSAEAIKPLARCDSCGANGWEDDLMSPTENRSFSLNDQAVTELDAASKLQVRWDRTMCKELKLHEGYANVCVLLIRWTDCDWPEEVVKEIADLKQIFAERFGYLVQILSLRADCRCKPPVRCSCSPQDRLDRFVTGFVDKHGGDGNEDNLIILYHTGHGTYDHELEHLELHGRAEYEGQPAPPKVIWNHTEQKLIQVARCDILTIMDTCFAAGVSATVQGEYGRTYEYLAASKADKTTPSPGPTSFTRALIASLKQLLEEREGEAFTTHDLQTLLSERHLRKGKKGVLMPRSSNNTRRIELRPLNRDSTYFDDSKIHAYLNLRIELKDGSLNEEELDELARKISRVVRDSKAKTRRVDLLSIEPRLAPPWRKAAKSVRYGLAAFSSKPRLSSVAEEVAPKVELQRPGLYASIGWVSPHLHPRQFTILLYRPWSLMFAGSVAGLLMARVLGGRHVFSRLLTFFGFWRNR